MYISRIYMKNFRNFTEIDLALKDGVTCIVGENNTGKSNLIYGLRLVIDAGLSSTYRALNEQDFHSRTDYSKPTQVIISAEFSDFRGNDASEALVGLWKFNPDVERARITYRFRPRREIVEKHENEEPIPEKLTLNDYHWEITGGGQVDPHDVQWHERIGNSVRFSDLQQFHIVFLPALRDVRQELGQTRSSPLNTFLDSSGIPEAEKDELVGFLKEANEAISSSPTIAQTGEAIDSVFKDTAGEAFQIDVRIGMSDPSFSSIARSLRLLLSNTALQDFEPYRNGLGLNNILYISMLMEAFQQRIRDEYCAGQLLLIEEPEAHLHPQLQRVLYSGLQSKSFQTIISSHSTHVISSSSLDSIVILTNIGEPATAACSPAIGGILSNTEQADLERYLDATKSTVLFARKVILVEGPAEVFLLPPLIRQILNIDLDRYGVSVIPIHGIHFDVYAKMFNSMGMPKKCAIIADGDLTPSDSCPSDEDVAIVLPDLDPLRSQFVEVFKCKTTFERAITLQGTLEMLASGVEELGAPIVAEELRSGLASLRSEETSKNEKQDLLDTLKSRTLNTAKRFGKARFAQIVSKHVHLAEELPSYIRNAVEWLEL